MNLAISIIYKKVLHKMHFHRNILKYYIQYNNGGIYMKKKFLQLAVIFLAVSSLSSCAYLSSTYEMNLDENNPIENNAFITFDSNRGSGWFVLKEWNGISITEGLYGDKKAKFEDKVILTIPAGETTLLFDMNKTATYNGYSATVINTDQYADLEITYSFESGKTYIIEGAAKPFEDLFTPGPSIIRLSEITDDETEIVLTEWLLSKLLDDKYAEQF
jgi:hypothetical protein